MISFERIVGDGLIACIPFSIVVWSTFLTMPRVWLHSLPPDIQAMAPPKTPREKRLTGLMGIFVLLAFFGVPIALTWRLNVEYSSALSLGEILLYLYGVWMIINLWDLVLIDWLYALLVNPNRPPIAGTAGAKGYKDYGFHLRAFLKASLFSLIIHIPTAIVIELL